MFNVFGISVSNNCDAEANANENLRKERYEKRRSGSGAFDDAGRESGTCEGSAASGAVGQRVGGSTDGGAVSHWENGGNGAGFLRGIP